MLTLPQALAAIKSRIGLHRGHCYHRVGIRQANQLTVGVIEAVQFATTLVVKDAQLPRLANCAGRYGYYIRSLRHDRNRLYSYVDVRVVERRALSKAKELFTVYFVSGGRIEAP